MFNFLFGFALGTFIVGLIIHFYQDKQNRWIAPQFVFSLSLILFAASLYLGWPLISALFK